MKTVTIKVLPSGQVQIQTQGYTGAACLERTARLEAKLGALAAPREHTPEYYEVPTTQDTESPS